MVFGELLRMLKFRSVSLTKLVNYPLKMAVSFFLLSYTSTFLRLKDQRLDQVDLTLKSIYYSRYFSIPSPEGNVYTTKKVVMNY